MAVNVLIRIQIMALSITFRLPELQYLLLRSKYIVLSRRACSQFSSFIGVKCQLPHQHRTEKPIVVFILNIIILKNRLVDKTSDQNSSKCSQNVSVLNLFLYAISIYFGVVYIYLYFSTLSNSKDFNYTIPTANVVLHCYQAFTMCHSSITIFQPVADKASVPSFVLFIF